MARRPYDPQAILNKLGITGAVIFPELYEVWIPAEHYDRLLNYFKTFNTAPFFRRRFKGSRNNYGGWCWVKQIKFKEVVSR